MVQMRSIIFCALLLGCCMCAVYGSNIFSSPMAAIFSKKSPKKHEPFDTVAKFLLRFGKDSDLEEYTEEEISRAMRSLAKSQSALKTMDGVTHQLRNVLKESSSLKSRFEKLLSSKRKKLKEAAKVYEYTRTVERGLQSAEIIQSASAKDAVTRNKYLSEAGLVEVKRATVSANKVRCVVSVLVPKVTGANNNNSEFRSHNVTSAGSAQSLNTTDSLTNTLNDYDKEQPEKEQRTLTSPLRFHPHEVVVCITEAPNGESTKIARILRLVTRTNQEILYGIEDERNGESNELMMQRTYLELAHKVLDEIREFVSEEVEITRDEIVSNTTSTNTNGTSSHFSLDKDNNNDSTANVAVNKRTHIVRKYDRIRVIGHSAGGAVAALVALILDGGVFSNDKNTVNAMKDGKGGSQIHDVAESSNSADNVSRSLDDDNHLPSSSAEDNDNNGHNDSSTSTTPLSSLTPLPGSHPLTSLYTQRVQCLALGPPPCMSRVIVPKYITSVVCGDDLVPRAQTGALLGLQKRINKALKAGAGTGSLGYILSAGVLKDLSALTRQNLGHYKGKKSTSDLCELCVPGRVFFIKPRKLKEGATIQRVMRGNWQEDMLWQLKEILLSKRMLEHHTLESYIRTLNRC